jgi:chitin disaccharide deacetylase
MARGRHLFAALPGGVLGTTTLVVLCLLSFSPAVRAQTSSTSAATLIIRSDDAGMSHSVNMALQRLIQTGLPLSISVMFPTPWYQEIVGILKQHPEVSVGIHLTLNSEWRNYRWGPIVGREAVPTLVDSNGYFFQSSEALHDHHPDLGQVEKELRAQIDRALQSGLKIDYVDYHMGTAVEFPEFREIVERLAHEYSLGMMGYFGDQTDDPQYRAAPASKGDSLVALVNRLQSGVTVLVTHVGIDDGELGALVDMNTAEPLADMSKNRQGELDGLTSPRFAQALKDRHIHLITYRELIGKQGLQSMKRPPQ